MNQIPQPTRVHSVEHLRELANAKMAVLIPPWGRRSPAAVVLHMQAASVLSYIDQGLYVYHRKWRKPKALLTEGGFKTNDEVRMRYDWHEYDPRMFVVSETFDGYVYLTSGRFVNRDKLERVYR